MVKVQKPQPKSLNKGSKIEGVAKDKLKVNKNKKPAKAVAVKAVEETKKIISKKTEKKITKVVAEVKPPKVKPAKKPLVLAPPESPAAPAPKATKKAKDSVVVAKKATKDLVKAVKGLGEKKPKTQEQKTEKKQKEKQPQAAAAPAKKNVKKPIQKEATAVVAKTAEKPIKKDVTAAVSKKAKKQVQQEAVPAVAQNGKNPVQKKTEKAVKKTGKEVKAAKKTGTEIKAAKKTGKEVKTAKKTGKEVKPVTKKIAKAANKKGKGKGKAAGKAKKSKTIVELNYELKPFEEDKFFEIVSAKNVQKVCEALKTQVSEEVKKQKSTSIFSDYRFILQVCSYKIPSCPKRVVKLGLKHSLIGTDDDVAIIVTDLQRGARFEYEPTVQHYEDLFREAGVEQRLTVVPFNRLRNDMGTFEAKRKFVNSYDYLLCDGRISGQANAFLGNSTQKPRNVLHAVRLSKTDQLSKEISRALCRTAFRQLRKGDLTAISVGNHEHSGEQLAENILHVVQQLQQQYPGGLANIRSIYVKIDIAGTSSLPLYISMCSPPADVPYVVGPREQRMLKLKKQANEVLTKFALTKDVDFIKLTNEQVERKAEVRKKRLALKEADAKDLTKDEEASVPAKKARKNAQKPDDYEDDEEIDEDDDDEDDDDEATEEDEDDD